MDLTINKMTSEEPMAVIKIAFDELSNDMNLFVIGCIIYIILTNILLISQFNFRKFIKIFYNFKIQII